MAAAAVACLVVAPASAQVAGGRGLFLTPTLGLESTLIEVRGRPSGNNGLELVTRLSPGISLASRSGRVQGSLSYTAGLLHRYKGRPDQPGTEWQNALSAAFLAEAVPNWAFVDVRASISQQLISAYGERTVTATQASDNRTEVRTLSISPYVRGRLVGDVDYTVRLLVTGTDSSEANTADSATATTSATLGSASTGSRLGWSLTGSDQRTRFRGTPTYRNDRVNAAILYRPDVDLTLSLTGGTEGSDVGTIERRRYENYGGGLRWTPSPRTAVSLQAEERYFGRSHQVSLDHRTARTVWRYADSRGVANGGDGTAAGQPITLYQLLFSLYASAIPDPVAREAFVRALVSASGADPNQLVAGTAVNTGITLTRRQELGTAWQGARLGVNLSVFRNDTRRIDNAGAIGAGDNADQSGYAGGVSWRLTPTSGLTLNGSRQMTRASGPLAGSEIKTAGIGYTTTLGPRITALVNARYSVNNGGTDPYRETAVSGALSLRF